MLATLRRIDFWLPWLVAVSAVIIALFAWSGLDRAYAATMRASFYGAESGSHNADGSRFAPMGFTAAHRSLPFGTRLEVCLSRCVVVTVRDRGPAGWTGRSLDLSRGAARVIGLEARGVAAVEARIIGRGRRSHGRP